MRYMVVLEMDEEDFESFKQSAHDLIPGLRDWELIKEFEE